MMAGSKRDPNKDLRSYLDSHRGSKRGGGDLDVVDPRSGVLDRKRRAPGSRGTGAGETILGMPRRQFFAAFAAVQGVLLVGIIVYLRGPVERMKLSVADYSGDGIVQMTSGSFTDYGYSIDMPTFSLSQPFEATYTVGNAPWTDKVVYFCLESEEPINDRRAFSEGSLEIRVLNNASPLLEAEGRIDRWAFGGGRGGAAIYHEQGFHLDAKTINRASALTIELKYRPGSKYFGEGTGYLKMFSGGAF